MRWYLGVGLLLAVALIFQLGLLAYAMYVMLGLLLVSRLLARSWTEKVTAGRRMEFQQGEIGEKVPVQVTIRNNASLPVPWVVAEDVLPKDAIHRKPARLHVDGKRQRVNILRGGATLKLEYSLVPQFRGFYQVGPVILEGGDLFGLYRRFRLAAAPHFLLVYPRTVPLIGYDLASRRPIGEVRLTHRLYEDPTRIAGVRLYQNGDPLNRVHWKATARTGQLHCKIYEPSTITGATIVLDFHRGSYHPRGEPFRSELAVTAAASLALTVYQMGQQVGLLTNGRDAADRLREEGWNPYGDAADELVFDNRLALQQVVGATAQQDRLNPVVVETSHGPEQLQRLRETLARLELNDGLTFASLIAEGESHLPHDATVVALLPAAPPETALALSNLKAQGYAVTVILITMEVDPGADGQFARLLAEGLDVRHVYDEAGIASMCYQQMLR
jgi:uncharacterized protein (DUF58 family)